MAGFVPDSNRNTFGCTLEYHPNETAHHLSISEITEISTFAYLVGQALAIKRITIAMANITLFLRILRVVIFAFLIKCLTL